MKSDIEQVVQAFKQWRSNRSSREHTPEHLRVLAVALTEHYPSAEICKRLRINSRSIKAWTSDQPQAFVALPVRPTPVALPSQQQVTLKMQIPNGIECQLTGAIEVPFIASLLRALQAEVA